MVDVELEAVALLLVTDLYFEKLLFLRVGACCYNREMLALIFSVDLFIEFENLLARGLAYWMVKLFAISSSGRGGLNLPII